MVQRRGGGRWEWVEWDAGRWRWDGGSWTSLGGGDISSSGLYHISFPGPDSPKSSNWICAHDISGVGLSSPIVVAGAFSGDLQPAKSHQSGAVASAWRNLGRIGSLVHHCTCHSINQWECVKGGSSKTQAL